MTRGYPRSRSSSWRCTVASPGQQAAALLTSLGFPRDDEAGVPFDPERHEVADVVDDPSVVPGIVVKVLRPGYGRPPGLRLRPAAVLANRERD